MPKKMLSKIPDGIKIFYVVLKVPDDKFTRHEHIVRAQVC